MRFLAMLLVFPCLVLAQLDENWSGYGDTARIVAFKADSTKYSKAFKLSALENLRVTCFVDDSTATGFGSDSCKFEWGIQTFGKSFRGGTYYRYGTKVTVDTLNALTAANFAISDLHLDSTNTLPVRLLQIDSTANLGYMYQTRQFTPEWDVYFRFWARGLTGNKVGAQLKLIFQVDRRSYQPTRAR